MKNSIQLSLALVLVGLSFSACQASVARLGASARGLISKSARCMSTKPAFEAASAEFASAEQPVEAIEADVTASATEATPQHSVEAENVSLETTATPEAEQASKPVDAAASAEPTKKSEATYWQRLKAILSLSKK